MKTNSGFNKVKFFKQFYQALNFSKLVSNAKQQQFKKSKNYNSREEYLDMLKPIQYNYYIAIYLYYYYITLLMQIKSFHAGRKERSKHTL